MLAGEYEAIYGNMPPFGLGEAGRLVSLADAKTAGSGSGPRPARPTESRGCQPAHDAV